MTRRDTTGLEDAPEAKTLAASGRLLGRPIKRVAAALTYSGLLLVAVLVHLDVLESWVLEGWLIAAVSFPVATHAELIGRLARIGLIRQLLLVGLIALVLVGHLFLGTRTSFPFVAWRMYGIAQNADPAVYEYRALLRSGREVPIVPSRVLSGFTASRFSAELLTRIRASEKSRNERRSADYERRARTVLSALARVYNRSHPEDPSQTILVFKKVVSLNGTAGSSAATTPVLLWRVPVN